MNPAIFDAELLAAAQHLIAPERLNAYLRDLDRLFNTLVDPVSADETLQRRAHKIVSQAGMLGLTRMAECARQVENACRAGSGRRAAVLHCWEAIADVPLYAMPAAGSSAATSQHPPSKGAPPHAGRPLRHASDWEMAQADQFVAQR